MYSLANFILFVDVSQCVFHKKQKRKTLLSHINIKPPAKVGIKENEQKD